MKTASDNEQLYRDHLEALDDACCDYKASIFGLVEPNVERRKRFLSAEAEYKKAIKSAIKYLRDELKSVEESCWRTVATTENE